MSDVCLDFTAGQGFVDSVLGFKTNGYRDCVVMEADESVQFVRRQVLQRHE